MTDFQKIEFGLGLLLRNDGYLLKNNVSERAITHKLGEHLQGVFADWNVDCEFNKNLTQPKELTLEPEKLLQLMAEYAEREIVGDVRPWSDLISGEDRDSLITQLKNPAIIHKEDTGLIIFVLKMNGIEYYETIFPDIIIHHRGTKENHIVVEAKKTTNRVKPLRYYDLLKLATLVSNSVYKYDLGFFVDLPAGDDFGKFRKFEKKDSCFPKVYKYLPVIK